MKRIYVAMRLAVGMLVILSLEGCGEAVARPQLGKVSGKVTYKGKPLTKGSVVFTPVPGKGGETGPAHPDRSILTASTS